MSSPGVDGRTAAAAVSLRALHKKFGQVTAVDGVDLDISDGEFFSMLGPSGSGKTTAHATFTAGAQEQTLPIWIFNNLFRPNQAPVVNVVAAVLVLLSIIPIWIAQKLAGTTGEGLTGAR